MESTSPASSQRVSQVAANLFRQLFDLAAAGLQDDDHESLSHIRDIPVTAEFHPCCCDVRMNFRREFPGRDWTARSPATGRAGPDGSQRMRVPFEFAIEIRRVSGETVEPSALTRAFREGLLPSAEALALEKRVPMASLADPGADQVAVEDIASATAQLRSGISPGGIAVLSVVATVVLICVLIASAKPEAPSCSLPPDYNPGGWGVQLNTRPFDRYRGCYVGDPPAVADPWPGAIEAALATAMGDPATSHVLAK